MNSRVKGFSRVVASVLGTLKLSRRSSISLLFALNISIICYLSYISRENIGVGQLRVTLAVGKPQSLLQKLVPRVRVPDLGE